MSLPPNFLAVGVEAASGGHTPGLRSHPEAEAELKFEPGSGGLFKSTSCHTDGLSLCTCLALALALALGLR